MTKACILHLGVHKTGSTFIQNKFAVNKEFFDSHSFSYPIFYRNNKGIENHSRPLSFIFEDKTRGEKTKSNIYRNSRENFEGQLVSACEQSKNLILSGEDMSLWNQARLEGLLNFLSRYFSEIIPVIIIRPPYGFHCSQLQQLIKSGKNIKLLQPMASEIDTEIFKSWQSNRVTRLRALFGNDLKVYKFQEAIAHPDGLFNFFLEKLSLPKPTEQKQVITNKSMSNKWVRLQSLINYNYKSMPVKDVPLLRQNVEFKNDAKFLLSNQELSLINTHLDIEQKRLSDLLGNDFVLENINLSQELMVDDWVEMASKLCNPKNFRNDVK